MPRGRHLWRPRGSPAVFWQIWSCLSKNFFWSFSLNKRFLPWKMPIGRHPWCPECLMWRPDKFGVVFSKKFFCSFLLNKCFLSWKMCRECHLWRPECLMWRPDKFGATFSKIFYAASARPPYRGLHTTLQWWFTPIGKCQDATQSPTQHTACYRQAWTAFTITQKYAKI